MSIFANVVEAPAIEVFALTEACRCDPAPERVPLTCGTYMDEGGQPWVLPVVRTVEKEMANNETLDHEYLPVSGLPEFTSVAVKLLLGNEDLLASGKADGVQALGGTGAIFLGLEFMQHVMKAQHVFISGPTWPNHRGISTQLGLTVHEYRYWDDKTKAVDFSGFMEDIKKAPENSVLLLHACAHNPTGVDLDKEQWRLLADVIKANKLFPFFDIAYQGFATGDLEVDAWVVRHFVEAGFEMFVAQSFSKNFGLYNERVGNLAIITSDALATKRIKGQMKGLVRKCWSNPPQHGARIVATVLGNPQLTAEWKGNVAKMASRVREMRVKLHEKLNSLSTPGNWDHIIRQIGMFSFTGLSKGQAEYLRVKHHVYIMSDGRVNICGLNEHNIDYVAKSIHETVINCPP